MKHSPVHARAWASESSEIALATFSRLLIWIVLVAISPVLSAGEKRAEEILLPQPMPGKGWVYRSGNKDGVTSSSWTRANESFNLRIIHRKPTMTPGAWRDSVEDYAKANLLDDYRSAILLESTRNNYRIIEWKTQGVARGTRKLIVNLSLYTEGEDAIYYVFMRWTEKAPSDDEVSQWREYFDKIMVVDVRKSRHQGPPLERVLPNPAPRSTPASVAPPPGAAGQ